MAVDMPSHHTSLKILSPRKYIKAKAQIDFRRRQIEAIMRAENYKAKDDFMRDLRYTLGTHAPNASLSHIRVLTQEGGERTAYDITSRRNIFVDPKLFQSYPTHDDDTICLPLEEPDSYLVLYGLGPYTQDLFHIVKKHIGAKYSETRRLIGKLNEDPLTGAYNRMFLEAFGREHTPEVLRATKQNYLLFAIDLDAFKEINDRLGHDVGDLALIKTVEILKRVFSRETDFVCRAGGDEFYVIVDARGWTPELAEVNTKMLLAKVKKALAEVGDSWIPPEKRRGNPPKLGLTIGVARINPNNSLEKAKIDAEIAMMQEKPEIGRVLRFASGIRDIQDTRLSTYILGALSSMIGLGKWSTRDRARLERKVGEIRRIVEKV